jgi:hypothetical protein
LPTYRTFAEAQPHFEKLASYLQDAGRSLDRFGIEVRLQYGDGNPDTWKKLMGEWQAVGATHCTLNTMGSSLTSPGDHIRAISKFAEEFGLS